ncbi:hypothetical protein EYC84_003325 [Monilinia fructicola]|uniref:Uncharacterized protein n=1 Tax=Monilinia fructicola TaxID=38448 RepID=A0A5M9JVT4_MONFR|nr:hypothetical protein EYC84_003325 [Monilinia fructicola]
MKNSPPMKDETVSLVQNSDEFTSFPNTHHLCKIESEPKEIARNMPPIQSYPMVPIHASFPLSTFQFTAPKKHRPSSK